ncbi:MAG: recombinase family protein [Bifidobacteriaceae bacterium]|jgi:DNA invertase Pin-like site-specific DNA recombinase|nr:recombinase family protein [Bifidobacteriaceae bacterium]
MGGNGEPGKVTASRLARGAYLYVRQSSLRQVVENTESAKRQYALKRRAAQLGWAQDQITVIDTDQGQSGASAADRAGFQRLVAEVSMGHAGIVLGLEVSRLARNNTDWHRLLEICALSGTLICDEDGLYDPAGFNDRLLLGLKGTMSEAELHMIRARLVGGQLSKARRGELAVPLPIGLARDLAGQTVLDPDRAVRDSVARVFAAFGRTGSARAVVKEFAAERIAFPHKVRSGPDKGATTWAQLGHCQVLRMLHNPAYAGAFAYGRRRPQQGPDGRPHLHNQPQDQWTALIVDHHPGYITWDQYQANQKTLAANAAARDPDRGGRGPAREGPALLQGLAVCGRCGNRMSVHYHQRAGQLAPGYQCERDAIEKGVRRCQDIPGHDIDQAIAELVLEAVSPLGVDVAIAVQTEIEARAAEADQLRHRQVEQAQQRADLARRRYLAVDPSNRLVADTLEADWNHALRDLRDTQDDYDRAKQRADTQLTAEREARLRSLAKDFPTLWNSPTTPDRERKRMVRLVVEDVVLTRDGPSIRLDVRLRGGTTEQLAVAAPRKSYEAWQTDPAAIAELDQLLDHHTDREAAQALNAAGRRTGTGLAFTTVIVAELRRQHHLPSRADRLKARGMLTNHELAKAIGVHPSTINIWARNGLIDSHNATDKPLRMFDPPSPQHPYPSVQQGKPIKDRAHARTTTRGAV